jgi:hypothetical protein
VAPAGTVTVRLVLVAALTAARVAPKNTTLLVVVVLKLVPVMVTEAPTTPVNGVNDVMVGTCACNDLIAKKLRQPNNKRKENFTGSFIVY